MFVQFDNRHSSNSMVFYTRNQLDAGRNSLHIQEVLIMYEKTMKVLMVIFVILFSVGISGLFTMWLDGEINSQNEPAEYFNFKIIFQNENGNGNVRASFGTCSTHPDGTLIIDTQGEGWLVSDRLTEGTEVIMIITDNNTTQYNDDSIITLMEVVQ